jgi:soluble lytic murein transglycosylase-like protein
MNYLILFPQLSLILFNTLSSMAYNNMENAIIGNDLERNPYHEAYSDLPPAAIKLSLEPKEPVTKTQTANQNQPAAATVIEVPPPATPISPDELTAYFVTYGDAFNVDPNILRSIAHCESTFRPNAQNGPYGGLYQYLASTWSSTRNAMGLDPDPNLRYDAEEAIKTTAWKISVGGIGAWPTCGKRALAAAF